MMCKRLAALALTGLLAMATALPLAAQTGTEPSGAPAVPQTPGEVLILYPDEMNDAQRDNLRMVVQTFTYLGHTADYLPQSMGAELLSQYASVVCVSLEENEALNRALLHYTGRLYLLEKLPSYVPDPTACPRQSVSAGAVGGVAEYTLEGDRTFTEAVSLTGTEIPSEATYTAGTLCIGTSETGGRTWPLVSGWGNTRYLPLADYTTPFARAVLLQEFTLWLWPYDDKPHSYAQFLVVDALYPFTDPKALLALVEQMVKEKTPFVLSVMPIYENADFPAMQQFCEVLRYAQANGGAVILHAPIVQNALNVETLQQKLTDATQNYFDNGVYPVALEIPESWTYNAELRSTLGRYRTLFLYEDGVTGSALDLALATNDFVRLGAQVVAPALSLDGRGVGYLDCCATAVYLDSGAGLDASMDTVYAALNTAVPLKSLWDMQQTVYLNESGLLTWDGNALTVNGERVSLDYTPQEPVENYDYKRTIYYRATANLAGQNRVLIFFVVVALAVFLVSIYLARRQMKKRFFRSDAPPDAGAGKSGPPVS